MEPHLSEEFVITKQIPQIVFDIGNDQAVGWNGLPRVRHNVVCLDCEIFLDLAIRRELASITRAVRQFVVTRWASRREATMGRKFKGKTGCRQI